MQVHIIKDGENGGIVAVFATQNSKVDIEQEVKNAMFLAVKSDEMDTIGLMEIDLEPKGITRIMGISHSYFF